MAARAALTEELRYEHELRRESLTPTHAPNSQLTVQKEFTIAARIHR